MALSACPCDVCCQDEELSLSVRRQFEEDEWLRRARIDVCASRAEIGTGQHGADTALAGDPQARRMMGRAAADEKPGCDWAEHPANAIRHDLTISTSSASATPVRQCSGMSPEKKLVGPDPRMALDPVGVSPVQAIDDSETMPPIGLHDDDRRGFLADSQSLDGVGRPPLEWEMASVLQVGDVDLDQAVSRVHANPSGSGLVCASVRECPPTLRASF